MQIGVRELRQNASKYLDLVSRGETIEITNRGRLVARLVPPASSVQTTRDRLIDEGRLIPAKNRRGRFPKPLPPITDGPTLSEILAEDRADER